jgi:hypothetical protein
VVLSCAARATNRNSNASARSTAPFAKDSTRSGCAPMASTIAPIAGRRATSLSRTPVAIESKRLRLRIDADPRLAAAAGGVARFLADSAGLEGQPAAQLQAAVIAACQEAFAHLNGDHPHLDVTFTQHADRIEVAMSQEGGFLPAVGLDTIAGFAPPGSAPVMDGFDRVQYEGQGKTAVTRLTKYLSQTTSRR